MPALVASVARLVLLALLCCSLARAFVPHTALARHQVAARARSNSSGARSLTMMGAVSKLTGEELEKELSDVSTPVLLDVYAQWCGPCQVLAGELDKIAGLYGSKLRVLKVDSDEEPRIASALKVYGLPTIFLIKEGQLVHRLEGAMPASELTKLINHYLFGAEAA